MASDHSLLLLFLSSPYVQAARASFCRAFGPLAANLIQRRLLRDLLQGLGGLDSTFTLRIVCDPPGEESGMRTWVQELWHASSPRPQFVPPFSGGQDERLRHAFREAFAEGFSQVFAIGPNCPLITSSTLRQASAALNESGAVFGPSTSGGYFLIGCSRFEPRLFDIPWDRETTLRTSLARAAESGITTRLLPPLPGVETAEDWKAYKAAMLRETPNPRAPIIFQPLYQERIWGDRTLEKRMGRALPPGVNVGESWELVDRPEAQSLVTEGPLMGFTLEDLWTQRRQDLFGTCAKGDRFPLLLKILDAQEDLSLQVHPPSRVAAELGGEPKTEMWYFAGVAPGARIYAGLRESVTRDAFRSALQEGTATSLVHSIEPSAGDFVFIPSGRLHAIGAGLLIYEIQENSDTTYRVFDWNRTDPEGKPRKLHIEEALLSIDFHDLKPSLSRPTGETLVHCPKFHVRKWTLQPHQTRAANDSDQFAVITVVEGALQCGGRSFREGDSFLIPACAAHELDLRAGERPAALLHTSIPVCAGLPSSPQGDIPRENAGFYRELRTRIVRWAESRTGSRHPWLQYVLLAPDFFLLLAGLIADREVPARFKTLLASAIAYFMVPLDLFPEGLLGPAGYLDDIALAAFAITQLLNHVSPDVIRRHWAGEGDILALVQSIISRIDAMIGSGLVRQIRNRLGI